MTVKILIGDCVQRMGELPDNSVDSVVCDPPYHLTSIVKRFGAANAAPAKSKQTGAFSRASKGFMGQTWDAEQIDFIGCELSPEYAAIAEARIRRAAGMFAAVETSHRPIEAAA